MTEPSHDRILIVDFGSQVTQLIARRVREAGVYCEIAPFQLAAEGLRADSAERRHPVGRSGLGHPTNARRARRRRSSSSSACRSRHLLRPADHCAQQLGGTRRRRSRREFGRAFVEIQRAFGLFEGVWRSRRAPSGVDEPRRPRRRAAGRLRGRRHSPNAPFRHRADEERALSTTTHVPSGGRPHARRGQAAAQFRRDICG